MTPESAIYRSQATTERRKQLKNMKMINPLYRLLAIALTSCLTLSIAKADTQRPSDVTGVSGTAISTSSIRITWNQPWDDQGITGYNVYRNDFYYATVTETNFIDNAVAAKSSYRYAITAFDEARNFSSFSSSITVGTGDGSTDAAPPPPVSNEAQTRPSNLQADSSQGIQISLSWEGQSVGYNIYRDDYYYTTTSQTNHVDFNVSANNTYRYSVVGFDPANNFSEYSDTISVSTAQQSGTSNQTASATNLQADAINGNQVRLTWNAPSGISVKGYNVYRNNSYYTTTHTTSFDDWSVSSGASYSYHVVAYATDGQFSNASSEVSVTLGSGTILSDGSQSNQIAAPSGVQAESRNGNQIHLYWSAPENVNIKGYNIYRNDNYYSTTDATSFDDSGVSANSTYKYDVVAYDQNDNFSPHSNSVSVNVAVTENSSNNTPDTNVAAPVSIPNNPNGPLSAPQNMRSETLSANQVKLLWDAPASGSAAGYNLYQDNAYIGTIYGNSHTIPWIEQGRDYQFYTIAFDNSNTYSRRSIAIFANTSFASANTVNNQSTGSSVPAGYNLVFSDEFQGLSIDSNKWSTRYKWGPDWLINSEKQYYVDIVNNPGFGHNPFTFDGEHVTISAVPTPEWLKGSANWQPYLSGVLSSYNKFRMKYGYVEMRAKLPVGKGLWSAFWLLHQNNNDRRPEIDVVELLGDNPDITYQTYHYYDNGNLVSSSSHAAYGQDYTQDFHTYGMKWEPGKITWYVDGKATHSINDGNVSWEDMYLITNLAVGGWWPGDPDGNTRFPAEMKIDYIRAYQQ